jgi:alpha-soluble NSF attachment protein
MSTKGEELMAAGEKKLKGFTIFGMGKESNMEAAVEYFDKAAAQFKMAKSWDDAGQAYSRAGEVSDELKQEHEACNYYISAAKAYKNSDTKKAVQLYKVAVEIHKENNRFSTAAKQYKEIAQLEEKHLNVPAAIKAYSEAADCFQAEDSTTSGNQMLLKVAELSAGEREFKRAIQIYEQVAVASLDNNLLKYSVKEYLFKATICHFVMSAKADSEDMSDTEDIIEKYKDMHPAYEGSLECRFLEDCLKAFQDDDVEAFTNVVFKYDSVYKLDNWTASMLLELKQILKDGGTGGDGDPLAEVDDIADGLA